MFSLVNVAKVLTKQEFRDIFEYIDEAIIVCDNDGRVKLANRHFITVFRLQDSSIIHQKLPEVWQRISSRIDIEAAAQWQQRIKAYSDSENLTSIRNQLNITGPAQVNYQVYSYPIYDQDLGVRGRVWKFSDITDEVRLEISKDEFISIASHQLRNPITTLRGYISMINDGDYGSVPDNLQKPITALQSSIYKLHSLVNDLLDTSRLSSGKTKAEYEKTDLVAICREQAQLFALDLDQKQIELKWSGIPTAPITTDPKLVSEAIKNYLSNAIKYSPENSQIEVSIISTDTSWMITVTDQGIGIPEDSQPDIFGKMYRASNARMGDYRGTGLGLYYVKQVIELLKGKVGFESVENRGSSFWFKLPRN